MNDALMGILRVRNLISPPYVSLEPSLIAHEVSNSDHFVVLGSDGLFDFFCNDEVVNLVHLYMLRNPSGDPAKFLVEQLAARAADSAGTHSPHLFHLIFHVMQIEVYNNSNNSLLAIIATIHYSANNF